MRNQYTFDITSERSSITNAQSVYDILKILPEEVRSHLQTIIQDNPLILSQEDELECPHELEGYNHFNSRMLLQAFNPLDDSD